MAFLDAFHQARTLTRDALKDAGITSFEYVGEAFTPPCAVVVPGEPYFTRPTGDGRIPFRKVKVGVDVMLLVPRSDAKTEAAAIDDLINSAYAALKPIDDINIRAVSRPRVVVIPVSGSKYVGSVLSIEALAEEP